MKVEIRKRWSDDVVYTSEQPDAISVRRARDNAILEALKAKIDLRGSDLRGSDLRGSDLSGSNLRGSNLSGSDLRGSNLSDSNLRGSNLRGSNLSGSNLSGSDLRGSNLSDSNLRGSNLSDSNLSGSNLSGSNLSGSNLRGSNLSDSNLSGSNLSGSDLSDSNLSGSNLSGSDLSGRLSIFVPKIDKPHQKILAVIEAGGVFDMGSVHGEEHNVCGTTHCRAGWLIHFAGDAGRVLESCLGWEAAGALLSVGNCPHLEGKVPNFYASDDEALADIKRLAALEAASA